MTQQIINLGAAPNDGDGDNLRTAFDKVNDNFSNVWTAGPVGSNVQISGNTIATLQVNQDLALSPNGTGNIRLNNNAIPGANNTWFLGSTTNRWRGLYAGNVEVTNLTVTSGLAVPGDVYVGGNLTVQGNTIQIGNIVTDTKTIQLSNTAASAAAANGSGITVGANDNIATMLYSSTSNVWAMNIGANLAGNVTAPYFFGNGSQLTGVTASGVAAAALTGNTLSPNVLFSSLTSVGTLANLSVSGNVTGGNILTAGIVTATGNITGNYFFGNGSQLTGLPVQYGNANVVTLLAGFGSNTISTTGNITGGFILGNISQANGFPATYGNSNVTTLLSNLGSNIINGTGNISTTGNITAGYLIGNGSQLTGVTSYTNANAVAYGESGWAGNIIPAGNAVYSLGNATNQWNDLYVSNATIYMNSVPITLGAGNVLTVNGNAVLQNNSNTAISTTGNITANYFIGNGSQLTGIVSSYGNSNVTTLLSNLGSNTISGTGNITTTANISGAYIKGNGSGLTSLPAPVVTQDITSNGNMSIMTYDGVIKYVNYATVEPSSGNIAGGNISTTGKVTAGNIITSGIITAAAGETLILQAAPGQNADLMSNNSNNVVYVNDTAAYVQTVDGVGTVSLWTFDTAGNLSAPGNVSAVGNITGSYILGNGSQLTGISTSANTGNVTFNDQAVVGTGDQVGSSGLYLAPGTTSVGNLQYIRVRGGDVATHIHLDTGNNAYFDQYFGSDIKYVKLEAAGNVKIGSNDDTGNSASWTFGVDGNLTVPGDLVIAGNTNVFGTNASLIQTTDDLPLLSLSSGGNGSVSSLWVDDIGNIGTSNIAAVYVNPVPGSGNVRIAVGANGNAGPNLWDFDASGNLSIPGNINFSGDSSAAPSLNDFFSITSAANFAIVTDNANTDKTWNFSTSGNLTAPGNISAVGNITGSYILGNGSQLTGIASSYGNANVVANLAALGSNPISTTGNITAGNISTGRITLTNGAVIRDTAGDAVAFGQDAGLTNQGLYAVAIGETAGNTSQGLYGVAVGQEAGSNIQGYGAVAVGSSAGYDTQGTQAVAIGIYAGYITQGANSVAVGQNAGHASQGINAVAIGYLAGNSSQGVYTVAIGNAAGQTSQGSESIAIGSTAGQTTQGAYSVAVGLNAGRTTQGSLAVALGYNAGLTSQGQEAVAIGYGAGQTSQATRSIILNATGAQLNQTTADTFTVAPVRNDVANVGQVMFYNTTSKEITYGNTISVSGNITAVGNVSGGNLLTAGLATVTGNVTGGNIITAGLVSATGNVSGGNLNVTGNIVDTGALSIITAASGNVNLAPNGTTVLTVTTTGIVGNVLAAITATAANNVGYLGMPQNATGTATLTIADAGRHIYVTSNSQTITIPANSSVAYPIGTAIAFIAGPSATTVSIAITTDTMYLAGTGTTGTRTLAAYGMATAVKVAATTWYINGSGLT